MSSSVSDHGFSSISHKVNVEALLNQNGFLRVANTRPNAPQAGKIAARRQWRLGLLYVPNHDQVLLEKVVHWLQSSFSRSDPDAQTRGRRLPAGKRKKSTQTDAPDIVVSLRWTPDLSGARGFPAFFILCFSRLSISICWLKQIRHILVLEFRPKLHDQIRLADHLNRQLNRPRFLALQLHADFPVPISRQPPFKKLRLAHWLAGRDLCQSVP